MVKGCEIIINDRQYSDFLHCEVLDMSDLKLLGREFAKVFAGSV